MATHATGRKLAAPPLDRYSPLDDAPRNIVVLSSSLSSRALAKATGLRGSSSRAVVAALNRREDSVFGNLISSGLSLSEWELLRQRSIFGMEPQLAITDVQPAARWIMSGQPFSLRASFVASETGSPCLAHVKVEWVGEPFVVECEPSAKEVRRGYVDIAFSHEQSLPVCRATFHVTLFNSAGAKSTFRTTCAVLPSNPFSLDLSPSGSFVTGTFSARGVRNGNAFDTGIAVTLSNGDNSSVGVQAGFHWKFWDGGVGGSLVEEGDGSFGGHISVPGHGTWNGSISFHSPSGSGIFNKYHGREDMTIEISMKRDNGSNVSGTLTCRTMFRFGINVTRVAGEDFTTEERLIWFQPPIPLARFTSGTT